MLDHLAQNWHVRKPVACSSGGIVATQNRIAGEAGARILAAGGNAIDAAVATGLSLATVEPWNSGLGGVGFMLVYLAKENRVEVVDFGPISPRSLDPAAYPLTGGFTSDLFTWPTVKDDRNVHGPNSIAVPDTSTVSASHSEDSGRCASATCSNRRSNWPSKASRSTGS